MRRTRRDFVTSSLAALAGPRLVDARRLFSRSVDDIDQLIEAEMRGWRIPGVAAVVLKGGRIAWSKGYGWADIARKRPMDPDRTIQNIASITKTVTATAVMQQVERNRLDLDADVSRYLPFSVRHPSHPGVPITSRLLLTHRSGMIDGPAYSNTYACGEPPDELGPWLRDYLVPEGKLYRADGNFGAWEPGTKASYCNIGFGLLGHLVERVSGESFRTWTRRNIFEPLSLKNTGWSWSEIDPESHAIPYAALGEPRGDKIEEYRKDGLVAGEPVRHPTLGEFQPFCRYSFTTYPDGGLRISATQLGRFVLACMGGGEPILRPATMRQMLTPLPPLPSQPGQGLAWRQSGPPDAIRWGHNGADPGVRTGMSFRPSDGVGVIVFANRGGVDFSRIVEALFEAAPRW